MAETRLRTNYLATLELLSPLHVGAGSGPLLADYDFAAERGAVWVMDPQKLLEQYSDEELRHGIPEVRISRRLRPQQYPDYASYSLPTSGTVGNEILPCIKDVEGRAYLPGSSLKGGLRTVVGWEAARASAPSPSELVPNPKYAASRWEKRQFGATPNHDLMRGLLVDDTGPAPVEQLELAQVTLHTLRGLELAPKGPGYVFSVEALKTGTRLTCRIGIVEGLLRLPGSAAPARPMGVEELCRMGRERSAELIAGEKGFYSQCRMQPLWQFYDRLERRASDLAPNQLLLQIAWGTGWGAKTLGTALSGGGSFGEVRDRYRLGRAGAPFPKTRRIVERGGAPSEPLGWLLVTL